MKEKDFKNLNQLLEKIKTIGLFERIFSWKSIKILSYDAYDEFNSIDEIIQENKTKLEEIKHKKQLLEKDLENNKINLQEIKTDNKIKDEKIDNITKENNNLNKKITEFEKDYENYKNTYENAINNAETRKKEIEDERLKEQEQKFQEMKETWKEHEKNVEEKLKLICKHNSLEYISKEKVKFKGKPDNTIKIGEQYIIFDAKSPANNNLDNFPNYLKEQAKKINKYINEKDVRKSIYLVVPHNTIEKLNNKLKEFCINISNYKVYIISIDSLEPIIESLIEITNYKYTDQLSPEERDKISEIIGRFAHSTKRKIHIDNYMNQNFLEILDSCNDLDKNTKEKSIEYEKSYILNPSKDQKGKLMDSSKLDEEIRLIDHKRVLKDKKLFKENKEKGD
jgi:hypothetical protein